MNPGLRLVLDTNVVIDWLVFDDPFMTSFRNAVLHGHLTVLTNELATQELIRVLAYPELRLDVYRQREIEEKYRVLTRAVAMPEGFGPQSLLLPERFPRCGDRDDDQFLALAFHARASALVTRDKALIKLRPRAARFNVPIVDVQQMMALVGA